MADLKDTIFDNASGPRRATGDSITVEQHSIREQIEADKYLSAKETAAQPKRALRFVKIVPPGTV